MFINDLGLILNVLGTLFIAFAFGSQKDDLIGNTDEKGKKLHFSYFKHPIIFIIGIILIILGFLIQLSFIKEILLT